METLVERYTRWIRENMDVSDACFEDCVADFLGDIHTEAGLDAFVKAVADIFGVPEEAVERECDSLRYTWSEIRRSDLAQRRYESGYCE